MKFDPQIFHSLSVLIYLFENLANKELPYRLVGWSVCELHAFRRTVALMVNLYIERERRTDREVLVIFIDNSRFQRKKD